jgi:hypothetical protein
MPPQTPVTADKKADKKAAKGAPAKGAPANANDKPQPPEESIFIRYSPHHEFPLSSATSIGLHFLVLFLLIVGGWVAYKLGFGDNAAPAEVGAVVLDGGGGGNKHGVKGGAEGGGAAPEDVAPTPDAPVQPPSEGVDVNVPMPDPLSFPEVNNDSSRTVQASEAIKRLGNIDKAARSKIFSGVAGDEGKGGTGTGGGRGTGQGTGVGTGQGNGRPLSERERQMLRWTMTFNTQNGEDYLRQLRDIKPGNGAILAIPRSDGQFEVIRDLTQRPAVGQVEDLKTINRIFWIDDKPDSVATLARTLQIKVPPYFVAFFPIELEEELKRLEKSKANGANVNRIEETKFNVVSSGEGYRPNIVSVRMK